MLLSRASLACAGRPQRRSVPIGLSSGAGGRRRGQAAAAFCGGWNRRTHMVASSIDMPDTDRPARHWVDLGLQYLTSRRNRISAFLETPLESGKLRSLRAGDQVQRIGEVHSCSQQIQRFRYRGAVLDADLR